MSEPLVEHGDVNAIVDAFAKAVTAIEVAGELKKDAYRRQLRKMREQLDQRGGHIKAMDIIGLTTAKNIGLISQEQHDAERKRRSEDFSVKELPRRPVEFETGAVVSGILPCGYGDCMRLVDLSKASSYCTQHAKDIKPPRQYISGAMSVQDLDHQLEAAEKLYADAKRRLDDAERQLAGVQQKVRGYDAQHAG